MSNPYKYGSLEYKLFKTREAIDEAIESAKNFRSEQKAIVKIDTIRLGSDGYWGSKTRIPARNNLSSYFSSGYYSRFEETNETHIQQCYDKCIKYCEEAEAEVEKWHAENIPLIQNNIEAQKAIINYMDLVGISQTYSTNERVGRKKDLQSVTHSAGYVGDLRRCCKIDDNYTEVKRQLAEHRREALEWKTRLMAAIQQKKKEKEKTDAQLRLIAKSMELAATWGIEFSNNDELISKVQRRAEEEKAKEYGGEWDDFDFTGDVITGIKGWEID